MQFHLIIPALLAAASLGAARPISPVPCPDAKVDGILSGQLPAEVCCSYGKCKGDVVIAMV